MLYGEDLSILKVDQLTSLARTYMGLQSSSKRDLLEAERARDEEGQKLANDYITQYTQKLSEVQAEIEKRKQSIS